VSASADKIIATASDETRLIASLRAGDEDAFMALVEQHGPLMLRIAGLYAGSRSVAEEIVQETWVGVLEGIERFEGRSSLKTWMFKILTNIAQRRARQEGRSVPLSSLDEPGEPSAPSVAAERFMSRGDPWPGHWSSVPHNWAGLPEERLLSQETLTVAEQSMSRLPPNQRAVIDLRDVHGWTSSEVCDLLGISEANQRVLLHRARSKVRETLEQHLAPA
jgi:RNA polymerase sigma-70 factor (ECF subfamily)